MKKSVNTVHELIEDSSDESIREVVEESKSSVKKSITLSKKKDQNSVRFKDEVIPPAGSAEQNLSKLEVKRNKDKEERESISNESEYKYENIRTNEKLELLQRLIIVRNSILEVIGEFDNSVINSQEFNKVFSFDFINKIIELKPFKMDQLALWLDDCKFKDLNCFHNYGSMFMHEIFHYWNLRKNLKQMNFDKIQSLKEENVVDLEQESSDDLSEEYPTQKINHDNPYISKIDLKIAK